MQGIKVFFIVFFLILVGAISCCHKSVKIESSFDPLTLQLELEMNDAYADEDEILPKITITNHSNDSLALATPLYPFTLHFIVQDSLGNNVSEYLFIDYAFKNLEINLVWPGESIKATLYDLKEIYRFKPGSYHFQAFYGVPSNPSKRVNFTVNQRSDSYKLFVGYVYSNKKTVRIGKLKLKLLQ
jgi:hypothetical protein